MLPPLAPPGLLPLLGCEISFWPTSTLPSSRTAASASADSVATAGSTAAPSGALATRQKRNAAASRLRKNSLAPAKKKLPTEPPRQSKVAPSGARSTSEWKCTRNDRIRCLYGSETPVQRGCVPSTTRRQSSLASLCAEEEAEAEGGAGEGEEEEGEGEEEEEEDGRRWARSLATARASGAASASASRRHRERMSPTAGPPRTLAISAVEPPSSETGRT